MIGFYDYTVVVTYISLISSIMGMFFAIDGKLPLAVFCLAFSGLCDMFDGKIARSKKNRTYDERLFGVQIDSLCDVVCFGAFPAVICYLLGVRGILGEVVIAYYCVCSVIRLGFFNVLETNRQLKEDGANKYYHGLPITSITVILPLVFLLNFFVTPELFRWILLITMFVVGTLLILNFKLKKPTNQQLLLMVVLVAAAVIAILFFSKYHVIHTFVQKKLMMH